MKAVKTKIAESIVAGGLFDLEQRYKINYLEKEEGYTDKIELAILLKKKDNEYAYRSLRFSSENQLKEFIKDLCEAYMTFQIKRTPKDILNERLVKDYFTYLLNEITERIRRLLQNGNIK